MLQRFNAFLQENGLCKPTDRILLTVSGGVDSVVMAELFRQACYRTGIAHCNFQLRGKESDADEQFVQSIAEKYHIPFFSTRFCTADYAEKSGISIQMAARDLRYAWFEVIREEEGFDLIATAHHIDDQIETFFINLLRGTGISGLHGIPVRMGKVIRPLLFTSREEILQYASKQRISFREDSSNSSLSYTRNKIRHQLIPVLQSIDPTFAHQVNGTIQRIQGTQSILKPLIESKRNRLIRRENGRWLIPLLALTKLHPLNAWLFELLSPFEFNESTIRDLIRSLDKESGKTFHSPCYRITKDREQLIITKHVRGEHTNKQEPYLLEETTITVDTPIRLSVRSIGRTTDYLISADPNRATLDKDKLTFPLTIRKWKPGDFFYPLGMTKRKKLSDFFIDEKISIPSKEECWLLCSGNQIVWVIGYRIDHRFRVSSRTNRLLVVDFLPQ